MGKINQNLTGRSLRAFLLTTPVGAMSQITTDFNALFRKLRLVCAIAAAFFTALATVLGLLAGMVVVSKVTMGSPWGFGMDWFLDHLLVDVRGGHTPPCGGNVTTSRFQLPRGAGWLLQSGLRHSRLCYDDSVIRHLISWTQGLL